MAALIIDGYNLIGTAHGDLQAERRRLIDRLALYHKKRGHDVTVVFDGWKSGGRTEGKETIANVKVIYSRLGDKADLVIKRMIERSDMEVIIITSDREIMTHAWSHGCVPVKSEMFDAIMQKGGAGGDDVEGTDREESAGQFKNKGSSRPPSRKEKALTRALRKL